MRRCADRASGRSSTVAAAERLRRAVDATAQVQRNRGRVSAGSGRYVLQVQQPRAGPKATVRGCGRRRGDVRGPPRTAVQAHELGLGVAVVRPVRQQPGEKPQAVVRGPSGRLLPAIPPRRRRRQLLRGFGRGRHAGDGTEGLGLGRGKRLRLPGRRVHAQLAEHIERRFGRPVREEIGSHDGPGLAVRGRGQRREWLRGGAAVEGVVLLRGR